MLPHHEVASHANIKDCTGPDAKQMMKHQSVSHRQSGYSFD